MILVTFGLLVISSLWLGFSWARAAAFHSAKLSRFNAPLLMSIGLAVHSLAFATQIAVRIDEVLAHGAALDSAHPIIYHSGALVFIAANTLLVWVASMRRGRTYSKRIWFSYLTAVAAWCGFAAFWHWG